MLYTLYCMSMDIFIKCNLDWLETALIVSGVRAFYRPNKIYCRPLIPNYIQINWLGDMKYAGKTYILH